MEWLARWRQLIIMLVLAIAVGGCWEDKGAVFAACQLDAQKAYPDQNFVYRTFKDHVTLCMRSKSYLFNPEPEGCLVFANGPECFKKVGWF